MPTVPPRQKQVGMLIAQGLTNRQIAEQLGLALGTVDTHRSALLVRLGLHNAVQLTHYAIAQGWIKVEGARGRPRKDQDQ